jgi:hypothetical protein
MNYLIFTFLFVTGRCAKNQQVLAGVNPRGFPFIVREGSSIIYDQEPQSVCSEAFVFPDVVSSFTHSAATLADLVPCQEPSAAEASTLKALIEEYQIKAKVLCTDDSISRVKVACEAGNVPISRRLGQSSQNVPASFASRFRCVEDEDDNVALLECAKSLQAFNTLKALVYPSTENVSETQVQHPTEAVERIQEEQEEVNPTMIPPDGQERNLGAVTGRNQAGYSFEVLDGGLVSFMPRVGEECRESYILDNLSTSEKYNAVARTSFAPCLGLPSDVGVNDIDQNWDILTASVDCGDPIYISISCRVSFSGSEPIEMSRVAILQAFKNPKFLSSRVSCDVPSDNEKRECAAIATNYMIIKNHITN